MWTPDPSSIVTAEMKAEAALASTIDQFRSAIQTLIDSHAQSRRYDNGNSLAIYVTSSNPDWAAEAAAFVAWRDAVWAYAYAELDKVLAGEREEPSVDAILGELPELIWPF